MEIINIKEKLKNEELLEILAESVYMPTAERLNSRAEAYINNSDIIVLGASMNNRFLGIIVLDYMGDDELVILDIAVLKSIQKQGIGRTLIEYVKETYQPKCITAETDDDAIDFYRKIGFTVKSLGEKYPEIVRYECQYFRNQKCII